MDEKKETEREREKGGERGEQGGTMVRGAALRELTWLFLLVPKVGSLMGKRIISLLLAATMLLRPESTVPTSSAVNSANSWNPVAFTM